MSAERVSSRICTKCLEISPVSHGYALVHLVSSPVLMAISPLRSSNFLLVKVGFVAYTALAISTLQYGNGVHQWDVPLSNVLQFGKVRRSPRGMFLET